MHVLLYVTLLQWIHREGGELVIIQGRHTSRHPEAAVDQRVHAHLMWLSLLCQPLKILQRFRETRILRAQSV